MGKILAPKDIKSSQHGFEKSVAKTSKTVWFRSSKKGEQRLLFSISYKTSQEESLKTYIVYYQRT